MSKLTPRNSFLLLLGAVLFVLMFLENLSFRNRFFNSPKSSSTFDFQELIDGDSIEETVTNDDDDDGITETNEIPPTLQLLPEVQDLTASKQKKIRVCTIALNPRQGSLFRTNLLGEKGSGKYRYVVKDVCPWDWPRVRLISYVKCCETLTKVTRSINAAINQFDVVIVTGDEYCAVTDSRPQFRQYHGTQVISTAKNFTSLKNWRPIPELMEQNGTRFPLYIPLGPREEFLQERIQPHEIASASSRKFLYNFLGSMTSYSRQILKRVVTRDLATPQNQERFPASIHITDRWHIKVTKSNGYVEPDEYKRVLLNSVFTLCPTGHNPEAYRIYEALEAGSIPILAIDQWYERAKCDQAFKPFIEAKAPFVYLTRGWRQLQTFLDRRGKNSTWIQEKQKACIEWYKWWMKSTALRFEAVLEYRFEKRMSRGRGEESESSVEESQLQKEESEAIEKEVDFEEENASLEP